MTDEVITPTNSVIDSALTSLHIQYIQRDISKMQETLSNINSNYVPNSIFLSEKTIWDTKIAHLEVENEKRKEFQDTLTGKLWGIGIMAGAIVGIISFLAQHFIK